MCMMKQSNYINSDFMLDFTDLPVSCKISSMSQFGE